RLVTAGGRRAFVKAVGDDVNPDTPGLFRHEAAVLGRLPDVPYRAALRGTYDDGSWVALLLDDVDGRHPDLDDDADLASVRDAVVAQTRELTPDPVRLDVRDMAATAARWHRRVVRGLDQGAAFPAWFLAEADTLVARLESLAGRMPSETWVHLDIRDDNTLVRADGSAVLLDWGMSRPGPAWVDQVLLAIHRAGTAAFDDEVARIVEMSASTAPGPQRDTDVTDFVLALGASLFAIADDVVVGLPGISEFRRRESARLLGCAARRLGL
ncbi:MAG TPA: phosphotransferase, partial [Candidatus Nanopelagicales bacterium]|nr:phosphotransferase [Candidatus Nanopelagicales bacterium]